MNLTFHYFQLLECYSLLQNLSLLSCQDTVNKRRAAERIPRCDTATRGPHGVALRCPRPDRHATTQTKTGETGYSESPGGTRLAPLGSTRRGGEREAQAGQARLSQPWRGAAEREHRPGRDGLRWWGGSPGERGAARRRGGAEARAKGKATVEATARVMPCRAPRGATRGRTKPHAVRRALQGRHEGLTASNHPQVRPGPSWPPGPTRTQDEPLLPAFSPNSRNAETFSAVLLAIFSLVL